MDLQQQGGERLDRRRQGQVDRRKPAEERGEACRRASAGGRGGGARASRAGRRRPRAAARPGARGRTARSAGRRRAWGSRVFLLIGPRRRPAGPAAALPAAGSSRNSTRAVISAGLICLPYAGMLPPPGRAVADLVDQLVARQARADRRQVGAAPAAAAFQGVAVAAVLVLEHERRPGAATACCPGPGPRGPGRRSRRSFAATRARWPPGR